MLTKILIKNFTLIDRVDIDFLSGFTTVTGDTGSGKSILLNALSLIIGKRGSQNLLKNPEAKCVLEAEFNLSNFNLKYVFDQNNLDYFNQSILRREILPNGKSRSFVNDTPVNLDVLKIIGENLIDIHTQHQSLSISNNSFFFNLIDSLAEQKNIVKNFTEALQNYNDIQNELEKLKRLNKSLSNDKDYFSYLHKELDDTNLISGEQEKIESKLKLVKNSEQIKLFVSQIEHILYSSDESLENKVFSLNSILDNLSKLTDQFSEIKTRLNSLLIELSDIQSDLNNPNLKLIDDVSELNSLENRINLIYDLQKKHNVGSVDDLINKKNNLKKQLDESGNVEIDIKDLELKLTAKHSLLLELSKKISNSRKKIIPILKSDLESLLANLGMKNSSFNFVINKSSSFNKFGFDDIEVMFSANKGITHGPLFKIASGGELSRILLSVKYVLSKHSKLPTMIFDEIDTGVSGEISNAMANMMLKMSNEMQIIAITHLPQVAAKGNYQLNVHKSNFLNTTTTKVKFLNSEERIDQIAKMLAGDLITKSALNHAKELLN